MGVGQMNGWVQVQGSDYLQALDIGPLQFRRV